MIKQIYLFFISMLCILPAYSADGTTPAKETASGESISRDITLTSAGTLAEALGEDANLVDSLVVRGPINKADFESMWECTLYGELKVLDLDNAIIENGIVPDSAFFHKDVQYNSESETISSIKLEKLILPSNVTEIGQYACSYATNLRVLQLPASLRKIGFSAFQNCVNLTLDSFTLPESLETLGSQCFLDCTQLAGEIAFPQGLKRIESAAFMNCHIWSDNLPQCLEFLGCAAFSGCDFTEVNLPDNCELELDGRQFADNNKLVRAHLPETCEVVPEAIFFNCVQLKNVNIPSNAVCVQMDAFNNCESLQSISFPEGLEELSFFAFKRCSSLTEVILPSTLKAIGPGCFEDASGVKKLYSKAFVPALCGESTSFPNTGPFGTYEDPNWHGMSPDTPLYVPKGTGELYRSTWGWSYFKNIIETDNFPSLSVGDVSVDSEEADAPVFDLMGRRVNSPQPGQIYIRAGKKFTVKP